MNRFSLLVGLGLAAASVSAATAQDQVKYGTAIKLSPVYYLPVLAAQENGFFAKHNLAVEWVPSQSGPDMQRNLASGAIDLGSSTGATDIPAMSRGAPSKIVANLQPTDSFAIWVGANSRFQKPQDLSGAKFGVSRLSGAEHAYGLLVAKQLGLKDVQFIGTGGVRESLAVLVTGGIDGVILAPQNLIELKLQGKVKSLVPVADFLPKPWLGYTVTASKTMIEKRPDVLKRTVDAIFEANRYIMSPAGKEWTVKTMRAQNGYSAEGAGLIYPELALSPDGKTSKAAVENVAAFLTEYGLMKPGEVTNVDNLFTDQFVR